MTESNSRSIKNIEKRYAALESQFVVEQGPPGLADAVTFSNNQPAPIHRWFIFKEAFGANLLDFLSIDEARMREEGSVFMDPFCGSGTSILSGDLQHGWMGRRIGVETNPFIAFVANTKANWREYDPAMIEEYSRAILARRLRRDIPEAKWPSLSTFRDQEMFDKGRVSSLVDAVRRSRKLPKPYDDLFLLGVASVVERLSLYRRTGRALRKLKDSDALRARQGAKTETELRAMWALFASDIRQVLQSGEQGSERFTIVQGDWRNLTDSNIKAMEPGSVSLMVYSPPYLNQIDYTEVYKVESWLLGFTDSMEAMRNQRRATIRSHSSVRLPESKPRLSTNARSALKSVSAVVSGIGDRWHLTFPRTANGYFSDMRQSFESQFRLLEPGGQVRCVIGNSAHGVKGGRIAIATDLLLADIAKDIGFEVRKIQVARMLARKDHLNDYLRESVIWMRKPDTR